MKKAEINKIDVDRLNEPLKALAAFYSALAGNNCDGKNCELTTALGLGSQGSNEHKEIIKKWFPNDPIAKTLINQDCFQASNGSSYFTNYNSLIFEVNKDTVIVKCSIMTFDHGKTSLQNGHNKAIIVNNETITIKR